MVPARSAAIASTPVKVVTRGMVTAERRREREGEEEGRAGENFKRERELESGTRAVQAAVPQQEAAALAHRICSPRTPRCPG